MNSLLRVTAVLLDEIHADLSRPHRFAAERVTFLICRTATLNRGVAFLGVGIQPVADNDYEPSRTMGALVGGEGFRKILQYTYKYDVSIFHVHRHEHAGVPMFSGIDIREAANFVPDFFKVRPTRPHGAIVLSHDSMFGHFLTSKTGRFERLQKFFVVGPRLVTIDESH